MDGELSSRTTQEVEAVAGVVVAVDGLVLIQNVMNAVSLAILLVSAATGEGEEDVGVAALLDIAGAQVMAEGNEY